MQASTKHGIIFWVGLTITIISVAFMASFGAIFDALLNNMLVIDPEGKIFDTFTAPDTPIYLDFYFFNVTNPQEVQRYGAKPVVVEIGPYRYLEKFHKFQYKFDHEEGTVEYRQNTTYFFDKDFSVGPETDKITTLNAVMVIIGAMGYENKLLREIIWPEIEAGMNVIDTFTVGELTFEGWEQPTFNFDFSDIPFLGLDATENLNGTLYDILKAIGIDIPFLEANRIGLYLGQNGTDDGVFKVYTGEKGMDKYLNILEWNHATELSYWNDTTCNMLNGTDGTQFPPGIVEEDTVVRLFTTDLCRSIYFTYQEDEDVLDTVFTRRFIVPEEVLESPNSNEDNLCYCVLTPGDTKCLGNSMMNLAPCAGGAPVVLSTPHFYQGDQEDVDNVIGLNPQKEIHETYLDIEPTTGVVMEAAKRIQLNLPLRKYGSLPAFQNVPEIIFPILWASENAQIQQDDADSLQKALTLPYIIVYVVCGLVILIGLIMVAIAVVKRKALKKNRKVGELLTKK